MQTLAGRSNYACNVAFNADGTRLVSGSKTIWELDAGRGLRASSAAELFGPLTRDGRLLAATTFSDNKVTLYDVNKPQPLFTLAPAEKAIVAQPLVFSPDGRIIATTYSHSEEDRQAAQKAAATPQAAKESAKEMEQRSKEMMKEMMKNPQAAMQKSMEALTQQAAQQQGAGRASIESQVKLWDTATGRAATTITAPGSNPYLPGTIKALSFNADSRSIAVLADNASSVTLFDATTGAPIRTIGTTPAPATAPAANPFGIAMNLPVGFLGGGSSISTMAFSADGRLLATGGKESKSDFDMSAMMAEAMRGPMNSKGLAQLAYEKGMYILTAAQSFQAALEASEVGHGLLTLALVEEGLKLSAADAQPRNGEIVVREWFDFAERRVPAMQTEKLKAARSTGRTLSFIGEEEDRGLNMTGKMPTQRPRVFYRRELEAQPLIIARPATK